MFGNKQGWIISACIAVAIGGLLYVAAVPDSLTPPTGKLALALKPADIPVDPNSILPYGTSGDDAADLYRAAIDDYLHHKNEYERLQGNISEAANKPPKGVDKIVEAQQCSKMVLFAKSPEELINYDNETPTLSAIDHIGSLANQIALYDAVKNRREDAKKYAEAAFSLGHHLYVERVRFSEWRSGIGMMENAVAVFLKIDESRAEALKNFGLTNGKYLQDEVDPLWSKLGGIGTSDIAAYAGDFFQIARESPDLMWRVEGELKVGKYRFNAARRGDQLGAKKVLAAMANDPSGNPLVKQAAIAARDLTIEKYRMIGGNAE